MPHSSRSCVELQDKWPKSVAFYCCASKILSRDMDFSSWPPVGMALRVNVSPFERLEGRTQFGRSSHPDCRSADIQTAPCLRGSAYLGAASLVSDETGQASVGETNEFSSGRSQPRLRNQDSLLLDVKDSHARGLREIVRPLVTGLTIGVSPRYKTVKLATHSHSIQHTHQLLTLTPYPFIFNSLRWTQLLRSLSSPTQLAALSLPFLQSLLLLRWTPFIQLQHCIPKITPTCRQTRPTSCTIPTSLSPPKKSNWWLSVFRSSRPPSFSRKFSSCFTMISVSSSPYFQLLAHHVSIR